MSYKLLISFIFLTINYSAHSSDQLFQDDIEKLNKFLRTTQTLQEIENRRIRTKNLIERYRNTSNQWKSFYNFQENGLNLNYDKLNPNKKECLENIKCKEVIDLKKEIQNKIEIHFSVIAKNRILLIKKIIEKNKITDLNFNKSLLDDLYHEVKSVPLRWISKVSFQFNKLSNDINEGYSGWLKIIKQLFIFVFYILFGLALHRISGLIIKRLNEIKNIHARKAYRNKKSALITKSINLYSSFLPWIIQIIYFQYLELTIKDSYFGELIVFIPLFINYAYYRILKLLISKFFKSFTRGSFSKVIQDKLNFTVDYLSILFLSIAIILHLLRSAGGEGLLFYLIQNLFIYISIFNVFYIASKWDNELWKYIETYLPFVTKALNTFKLPLVKFLIHPILFLLVILHKTWNFVYDQIERFDIVKTLSAQIFRKQIDNKRGVKKKNQSNMRLDQYYNSFMYSNLSVSHLNLSQKRIYDRICEQADNFFQDQEYKPVHLITGEKGIGKTTILDLISERYQEKSMVKFISFSNRSQVESEINELRNLCESTTKKVIIIDGLQYLFISKLGGFELFKSFLEILSNEKSQNFIWCISINNYAWEFVEAVLKKNRYFNSIHQIERWNEEEISKLILTKNSSTNMTIKYDKLLAQAHIGLDDDALDVQNKYFRLLWEEAMGNPSKAKEIWLDSIEKINDSTIYAHIPDEIEEKVESLPNDYYFILANIVRHESINLENIIESTCLTEDIVRNALRTCIDLGLIEKTTNQYSLTLLKQHGVYSTLKRMNFIYG